MSRFLITTMPATGHVMPMLPLARELSARGHELHWYTGAVYREQIAATGATHHPIRSAEDFGGKTISEAFPELVGLTGIAMVRRAFKRVFIDNAAGMLSDCRVILDEHPADAVVCEPTFLAARWLHELGGPAWATVGISMLGCRSRDTAPFGPGLPPMRGPLGQLRNRVMNGVSRRVLFASVTEHYERARAQIGLRPLGISFTDTLTGPYLYLQSTVPGFEYPRRDLPPQVHFIGPLLPDPPGDLQRPGWWGELADGRPVVLVTQGTLAADPRQLLVPTLRALADEPVLVIATTGSCPEATLKALGSRPPANARIASFLPYRDLMPRVDALVTNGGYGTVQQALAHGVPIVVAGATEEKPENAARIAWSGVGIRLRTQSPSPDKIRAAVRAVLREPRYRLRAQAIRQEMSRYDAPRIASDLLEQIAQTGKPVTGRASVTRQTNSPYPSAGLRSAQVG
jgi:UDP:flavonoid glycosyltransferase YjiC (YdhE family)